MLLSQSSLTTFLQTQMDGTGTSSKLGAIPLLEQEQPMYPVANFSASQTTGNAPLNVSFTDQSTGSPTSWKWLFGDGTNATQQNPVHIYSQEGKYTVSLKVNNPAGSSSVTK